MSIGQYIERFYVLVDPQCRFIWISILENSFWFNSFTYSLIVFFSDNITFKSKRKYNYFNKTFMN